MEFNPMVSKVAGLLSDPSRSKILIGLMDGNEHAASELALVANIRPQTASFHLKKIMDSGVIQVKKRGVHRLYSLKDSECASILESFLAVSPTPEINSFNQESSKHKIKLARTCYDHLAGELGVKITNALVENGIIIEADEKNYAVSDKGYTFFKEFGINVQEQQNKRRAFARRCLDWTERQHHVAGSLGNSIITRMFELQWLQRRENTRSLKLTNEGEHGVKNTFYVDV